MEKEKFKKEEEIAFEERYKSIEDKKNNSPYFESIFPQKKRSTKAVTITIVIAFVFVFFVIGYSVFTAINNNKTYDAKITLFYYEGKEEPRILKKNETFALPVNPQRDGYNFVGWYYDNEYNDVFDTKKAINEDITIYAKWEKKTYRVYYSNIASTYSVSVKFDDELTLDSVDSYNFIGWTTSENSNEVEYSAGDKLRIPSHDVTLYAVYD